MFKQPQYRHFFCDACAKQNEAVYIGQYSGIKAEWKPVDLPAVRCGHWAQENGVRMGRGCGAAVTTELYAEGGTPIMYPFADTAPLFFI